MTEISLISINLNSNNLKSNLAKSITCSASKQTYYTIRLLADRDRAADAYRAYAYFRWVDDQLDDGGMTRRERLQFVQRQQTLIELYYRGEEPHPASAEEILLAELIHSDTQERSGLWSYIHSMMAVMKFDAERRGRLITQRELSEYTHDLARAVTEAMHYFIGHGCKSPQGETRYLAVGAAHVTHMLRDTLEDVEAGYFNMPREYIESHHVDPRDVQSDAYRKWIKNRVRLARAWFRIGRSYLTRVGNLRCRIAGFAYAERFESVLSAIERDDYRLRRAYPECKNWISSLDMGWSVLSRAFVPQQ